MQNCPAVDGDRADHSLKPSAHADHDAVIKHDDSNRRKIDMSTVAEPSAASAAQPPPDAGASQRPWIARISATLVRSTGIDTFEEITYSDGVFTRRFGILGGPRPFIVVVLDQAAREQLLAELNLELDDPPKGVDTK